MKKVFQIFIAASSVVLLVAAIQRPAKTGFANGTPAIKSISALAFGPDGILFVGDSKSATVFAINTKDNKKDKIMATPEMKQIDKKVAAALGTEVSNIKITDMAINPVSNRLYLAVQHSDGTPAILNVDGDKITAFSLKDVNYSSVVLNNAPAEDAKDQRGRSLRISAISDLGYADGKLLVSGLSNHEFSSAFKSIPFPFTDKQDESTLEIYHAAHGRYETSAPIKTFTTTEIKGKKYLVASYTCTPLVLFALDELKPGAHVKGRTVAEMGSGNTPIDMLTLNSGNEAYLLMANTARPVAKVDYKNIAAFGETLSVPVKGTTGVQYTTLANTDKVLQMDKLGNNAIVMLQQNADGNVDLRTANDIN